MAMGGRQLPGCIHVSLEPGWERAAVKEKGARSVCCRGSKRPSHYPWVPRSKARCDNNCVIGKKNYPNGPVTYTMIEEEEHLLSAVCALRSPHQFLSSEGVREIETAQ